MTSDGCGRSPCAPSISRSAGGRRPMCPRPRARDSLPRGFLKFLRFVHGSRLGFCVAAEARALTARTDFVSNSRALDSVAVGSRARHRAVRCDSIESARDPISARTACDPFLCVFRFVRCL